MRSRGMAISLSLLLAGVATGAAFLYLSGVKSQKSSAKTIPMVQVIVAKRDVPAGTRLDGLISSGGFTSLRIPAATVVEGAVTDLSQLQGRTTNSLILQGEQISGARLEGSAQSAATNRLGIPAGLQAVTISLEPQRMVGGLVQQGDHVVVYATLSDPNGGGQATATVVPDVQVLSVLGSEPGNAPGVGQAGKDTILTLALSPSDTARLVLAQEQGHIWLSLLGPGDHGTPQKPVTVKELVK
jgi:pilus assembly protein CpaB